MDALRFDTLSRLLGAAPSRRALLPLLGGLLAAPLFGIVPAWAKKKKPKKATLCLDGQTVQASKKKKKKLLKGGATPGACASSPPPGCTPTCAGNQCGEDDGCGDICGCAAGNICHSRVCHACNVSCGGDAAACGNELQTALTGAGGGTVFACPGRYVGSFEMGNGALVGAGDGEDPATNTILDANGNNRVMNVAAGVTAALHGLRITGGSKPNSQGGGIASAGNLTLTACTVSKNRSGDNGGGIYAPAGQLTLNACTISENVGTLPGGGIYSEALLTINGSAITGNEARSGGGITTYGTLIFDSASSVTRNSAIPVGGAGGRGGGIYQGDGPQPALNGATISDNTPENCYGVDGC